MDTTVTGDVTGGCVTFSTLSGDGQSVAGTLKSAMKRRKINVVETPPQSKRLHRKGQDSVTCLRKGSPNSEPNRRDYRPPQPRIRTKLNAAVTTRRGVLWHPDNITACAISSDGSRALTATSTTESFIPYSKPRLNPNSVSISGVSFICIVWDTSNLHPLVTLEGHSDRIQSCSLSSDAKVGISVSFNRWVIIWNFRPGLQNFVVNCGYSLIGALSGDGRLALTDGAPGSMSQINSMVLNLWDTASGQKMRIISDAHDPCTSINVGMRHICEDGSKFVTCVEHKAYVWQDDGDNWRKRRLDLDSYGPIDICAFSRNGQFLLTVHCSNQDEIIYNIQAASRSRNNCHVWDLSTGRRTTSFRYVSFNAMAEISGDGKVAMMITSPFTEQPEYHIKILDCVGGYILGTCRIENCMQVQHAALSADGSTVLAVNCKGAHVIKITRQKSVEQALIKDLLMLEMLHKSISTAIGFR